MAKSGPRGRRKGTDCIWEARGGEACPGIHRGGAWTLHLSQQRVSVKVTVSALAGRVSIGVTFTVPGPITCTLPA